MHTDESAQPLAVFENGHGALPAYAVDASQRGRVGSIDVDRAPHGCGLAFGKDYVMRQRIANIVIGEEFRPKRSDGSRKGRNSRERRERVIRYEPFRIDTATVSYLSTIGFAVRQARVIVA